MKFLFVEKRLRTDKLGILYLSSVLKLYGHETDLIQCDIEKVHDKMREYKPDYVLYSVMSGEHIWFLNMNFELKKTYKFKSIFGGPHFTFFPEESANNKLIDHIVIGPGEIALLEIINGRQDKIIKGQIPVDLAEYPKPDRGLLFKYDEFKSANMKRFIFRRDCPHKCTYCFNKKYHEMFSEQKDRFFQAKSPEQAIEEILEVKNTATLGMVYFNDDDFLFNKTWTEQFCNLYKEKINLPFCGSLRASSANERILDILKASGCHFMNIAIESAVPETQKILGRENISNEQIKKVVQYCEKIGIKIRLQNMIGLPVDDPLEDAIKTFEFNKEINPTDSWVSILQPFKNTDIWKTCVEKGLLDKDYDCQNFYEGTPLNINCKQEITTLHKIWYYAVKFKMSSEFLRIIIQQELDKNVSGQIQKIRWEETAREIYKM